PTASQPLSLHDALPISLAANHRVTLTAQVNGTSNAGVIWSVKGIAGGNAALGQTCAAGSNPCQPVTSTAASREFRVSIFHFRGRSEEHTSELQSRSDLV